VSTPSHLEMFDLLRELRERFAWIADQPGMLPTPVVAMAHGGMVMIDDILNPPPRPVFTDKFRRQRVNRVIECDGCHQPIPAAHLHLAHTLGGEILHECLTCAAKSGRPGVAEPYVAEQPVTWDGIA